MKIRDALPARERVMSKLGVYNSMHGGAPSIVCPPFHQISKVDDECAGYWIDFLPRSIETLDFKTSRIMLRKQDGERAVVAMSACAKLPALMPPPELR